MMAQIRPEEDLNESHKVFASEVIRALNKFCCIEIDLAPISDEVTYLTDGIYWGIITISFVFRVYFYKRFQLLTNRLMKENFFRECCMFIRTQRNARFFFNFLYRVSKIHELAAFCHRSCGNYFETAQNCIAQFQDKEYFESAGSWKRLDRIGSFLTNWSKQIRPLMISEIYLCFPSCLLPAGEKAEAHPEEEEKFKELKSKENKENLSREINRPVGRKPHFNSALKSILADDFLKEASKLGSIEDEIKSILGFIANMIPATVTKYSEEPRKDSNSQNDIAESSKPQKCETRSEMSRTRGETRNVIDEAPTVTDKALSARSETLGTRGEASRTGSETSRTRGEASRTRSEMSRTRGEASRTRSEMSRTRGEATNVTGEALSARRETSRTRSEASRTRSEAPNATGETSRTRREAPTTRSETSETGSETPDAFYEQIAKKIASSEEQKNYLKATYKELVNFIVEDKTNFLESSDSRKRENKTGDSRILEEDLYLSESSNDENIEQLKEDKDGNENKSWIGEDLQKYGATSLQADRNWAIPVDHTKDSLDDADYIKFLEEDLYVRASTLKYFSFSHGYSGKESFSTINDLSDEGDSSLAENNIPLSENNESLTINIKSEKKSEVKSSSQPLTIPTGSSAAASFTAEDSDSSSETNNANQLTMIKSAQSGFSSASEELNIITKAKNSKPQQRKSKRLKKKSKSKK